MADTRPERRFTRIDRLPPYVFNITAELKMAARRRGEDIIDFSMGNRTVRLRRISSKNYVLWPSARHAWLLHFTRHSAVTSRHFPLVSGSLRR